MNFLKINKNGAFYSFLLCVSIFKSNRQTIASPPLDGLNDYLTSVSKTSITISLYVIEASTLYSIAV
jgi:hypothetical protein